MKKQSKDNQTHLILVVKGATYSRWKRLIRSQGRGADVILATSNSYKATVDSIKGLRPDGRLVLMGASATNEPLVLGI